MFSFSRAIGGSFAYSSYDLYRLVTSNGSSPIDASYTVVITHLWNQTGGGELGCIGKFTEVKLAQ